ncbi:MAG: hypothetical protein IPL28_14155 [Chloroflexi bacterium]|nr:hypothetical protein [Chloroflexota bacterium]
MAGLAAVFGAIPVRAWGVLLLAPATAALWAAYWLREPWAGSIGLAGFMGVLAYAVWLGGGGGMGVGGGRGGRGGVGFGPFYPPAGRATGVGQ